MSRSMGSTGGTTTREVLAPVKYMLSQTAKTLSMAEEKLGGNSLVDGGVTRPQLTDDYSRLPAIKQAPATYDDTYVTQGAGGDVSATYGGYGGAGGLSYSHSSPSMNEPYKPPAGFSSTYSGAGGYGAGGGYGGSSAPSAAYGTATGYGGSSSGDGGYGGYGAGSSAPSGGYGGYGASGGGGEDKGYSSASGYSGFSGGGGGGADANSKTSAQSFRASAQMYAQTGRVTPIATKDAKGNTKIAFAPSALQSADQNRQAVAQVTHTIEQLYEEMHEIDDIIFFIEHSELVKIIYKVLTERARLHVVRAWRIWNGDTRACIGFNAEGQVKELRELVKPSRERVAKAEAEVEQQLKALVTAGLSAMDGKKRAFFVGILGKNGPHMKEHAFLVWKLQAQAEGSMERVWTRFFKKMANMKLAMGWRQWRATVFDAKLPPEEVIKALEFQVAKARKEMEFHENRLEAIVQKEMHDNINGLDHTTKKMLKRVMTNMFNRTQKMYFNTWNHKAKKAQRYIDLQIGIFNRMQRSFVNKGWNQWEIWFREEQQRDREREAERMHKLIGIMNDQVAQMTEVLKAQQSECDIMRQCIDTQLQCQHRILEARTAVNNAVAQSLDLALADPTLKLDVGAAA